MPRIDAVEVDVLPAGQFGVEAGADLEQAADPAVEVDRAGRRLGDAARGSSAGCSCRRRCGR